MTKFIMDIETNGLNPIKNRIISISLLEISNSIPTTFYGEDEKRTLEQFWNCIRDCEGVITFNGDSFDLPFIIARSLIHQVKIRKDLKNLDLRKIVNSFWYSYEKHSNGTLRDWASILGFIVETEDGEKMIELYNKKNWKEIVFHNSEDVKITKLLHQRCLECGAI
jgi:uncharacterized protein YprB with RNaseH-like and TPR domain